MLFRFPVFGVTTLILALLVFQSALANAQGPARLATSKEIRDMLVEYIDVQHKSDGIVVGVITKRAREVVAYGHFDATDPRVPDADTVFEIGSISKVFTSLLLADMVLKGEVKLDDPISKYLPASVRAPTHNGRQITLLDLATHYSGLPRMPNNWSKDYSTEQLYDYLSHYKLTRDPGQKYEYSNLGVGLLGQLLALRAGTDYDTLLRTRITEPLQMHSTAVRLTPEMKANLIPGHEYKLKPGTPWEIPALLPAGGIRSTVNDLMLFLAANMGIIKTPLTPAMKKMLSVRRPVSPGVQIALGWHIGNGSVINHTGQTYGYDSFIAYDSRRQVGVVVLSNSYLPIDEIGWKVLRYPAKGVVEQQPDIPNLHP